VAFCWHRAKHLDAYTGGSAYWRPCRLLWRWRGDVVGGGKREGTAKNKLALPNARKGKNAPPTASHARKGHRHLFILHFIFFHRHYRPSPLLSTSGPHIPSLTAKRSLLQSKFSSCQFQIVELSSSKLDRHYRCLMKIRADD
jgi:hypothetical protein